MVPVCVSSVHFCTYKEKFISLYCRLSSVLDLDALITQQALREAITDSEVASAKHRHQLILDYIQVTAPPHKKPPPKKHTAKIMWCLSNKSWTSSFFLAKFITTFSPSPFSSQSCRA